MKHGYCRVSTVDQSLDIQIEALTKAGCEKLWMEKRSGTTRDKRAELAAMLAAAQPGDEIWVTKVDRFARSIRDLANIVTDLKARGIKFAATDQPIDTGSATGWAFCAMLGVFSELETELRKERQLAGIAKAKASGVYKGRPATIDAEAVRALDAAGVARAEIAKRLNVGRASVYRLLNPQTD